MQQTTSGEVILLEVIFMHSSEKHIKPQSRGSPRKLFIETFEVIMKFFLSYLF